MADLVSALNIVDLPTLGNPTIPAFNPMVKITENSISIYYIQFSNRMNCFEVEEIGL